MNIISLNEFLIKKHVTRTFSELNDGDTVYTQIVMNGEILDEVQSEIGKIEVKGKNVNIYFYDDVEKKKIKDTAFDMENAADKFSYAKILNSSDLKLLICVATSSESLKKEIKSNLQ